MGIDQEMNSDLRAFEACLSALTPTGADRDALMFAAGRASAIRSRRRWQLATAAAACLAAGAALSGMVHPRPQTRVVDRIVYVQRDSASPVAALPSAAWPDDPSAERSVEQGRASQFSYFRIRQRVLEQGLSALPSLQGGSGEPQDPRRLMQELLQGNDVQG